VTSTILLLCHDERGQHLIYQHYLSFFVEQDEREVDRPLLEPLHAIEEKR